MHVCMYVCMHAFLYVYIYIRMCAYVYIYTCKWISYHMCLYIYTYVCLCVCVRIFCLITRYMKLTRRYPKGPKYPNMEYRWFVYQESQLWFGVYASYLGTWTLRESTGYRFSFQADQRKKLKLSWLPYLVLINRLNFFLSGWRTEVLWI